MRAPEALILALASVAYVRAQTATGCSAAADCYAAATAADLAYLELYNEGLFCDPTCSEVEDPFPIHCNQFGLGQNCRQCFNSDAAAAAYFARNPNQLNADTYALCPGTGTPDVIVTQAPTSAPTVAATGSPTAFPTAAATASPTVAATASPTVAATAAPTVAATAAPTVAATAAPTVAATAAPTEATAAPTVAATAAPTVAATAAPTEATAAPTVAATAAPTAAATNAPTAKKTAAPTVKVTPAPSAAPVATPKPSKRTVTLPPVVTGRDEVCCSSAQDCYDKATDADLEYLQKFDEQLICDTSCSIAGGIHCNIFGICQNCRQCFNGMDAVNAYRAMFPSQANDAYILCENSNTTTTPTAAPTTAATTATAGDVVPGTNGCSSAADCYATATSGDLDYLTKFGKSLVCDANCSGAANLSHCNMFGLGQDCRGCFNTQADADSYFQQFPDQAGDSYTLCDDVGSGGDAGGSTAAPTAAPTVTPARRLRAFE